MSWKDTLAKIAPTLGLAIGGPFGALAGNVVGGLLDGDDPIEALETAVKTGDPAAYARIKEADQAFKVKLEELGIQKEELHQRDRSSARDMFVKTRSIMTPTLALVIVLSFVAMVGFVLVGSTPVDSVLAGTLIGYLSAKAEQVVAFYFGSSAGSKAKTDALAGAMKNG